MVPDKTSLRPVPSVFRAVLWTLPVWAGLFSGIYTTAAWAQNAGFRLLSCNERRIEVGFELPGWRAEAIEVRDSRAFSVIRAGEGGELLVAGFPVLPEYKAVIAVPPGSRATVNWQTGGSRELTLPPILPAQPAGEYGEEGGIGSSQKVATSYSADFDTSGAYPAEPVVVRGPKRFRDVMVIEILLRPFVCLQGNAGRLRVLSRVTVSLDLAGSSGFSSAGAAAHPSAAANTGGAFENIYNQVLLNYESSRRWRVESQLVAGPARLSASPFLQGDRWVSIRIAKSDMYALTPELLSVAGVGMEGVDPATFRIYTGDGRMLDEDPKAATLYFSEVSTEVTGSADGTFDPGDRLIFFGRGLDRFLLDEEGEVSSIRHRYDSLAVYWLTWGNTNSPGRRMVNYSEPPAPEATPAASAEFWYHWEENTEYLALENPWTYITYNPAPDYWAWKLDADETGDSERSFDLELAPDPTGNSLRCQFYGTIPDYNNIDYRIEVNQSNVTTGQNSFYRAMTTGWAELPAGVLTRGRNSFTLKGRGQVAGFFELRIRAVLSLDQGGRFLFHRTNAPVVMSCQLQGAGVAETAVYEVTNPLRPVRITGLEPSAGSEKIVFGAPVTGRRVRSFSAVAGGAYAAPLSIRAETLPDLRSHSGAQYLVISPRELGAQAVRLAALRSSRYQAMVVFVEDIYNEFSYGPADPVAVRNFLKYAFENWAVPPEFVLFFGDGNNDFRGGTASGRARANYILPFIDANDLALEEWFVRFTDKDLPQIAHGRLPVQNENEAAVVVDKIINYERGADPGDWVRRAVLVADDGYILGGKCDPAAAFTHFETACENLDSLLPGDLERIKVYLQQYPFDPPGIGTRKPAATDDLLKWWNRGALIVNYFGHGSELHWAQERAFDVERDLPMLTNGYRLPLLLNASCSIGHFDDYRAESMVERVIAFGGGGAVAAYAGTRITFSQRNNELSRLFVDALFSPGRDSNTIGASALVARLAMNGTWGGANAQRYSIFGDPAMCLHDPARTLLFQLEGRGPSYKMGEKVSFTGTVVKKNNETDNLFSGVARIKFLGGTASPVEIAYECTDDGNIVRERSTSFVPQQMVIFDGPVTVTGGHFSGNLVLPLNLAGSMPGDTLSMETGRFIGYATCPSADGSGASVSIPVASHSGAYSDTSAPRISLIRPGLGELRNGDKVSISEPLLLVINDESGINTTGRPGVQLSLEVDEGTTYSADLTGQFSYRQDSYQEGTVTVELAAVEPGLHAFRFRATDNLLNSATAEWMLQVAGTAESLTLSGVMNYPNPFRDRTDICFEVSGPANVLVRIFTVAGRPVRELVKNGLAAGFNTVGWDGADEYGHKIANGVYIYKIICMPLTKSLSNDTKEVVAIGKALLSR